MALDLAEQATKFAHALEARAAARGQQQPPPPLSPPSGRVSATAPFGRHKGQLLSSIDSKDLEWLANALRNSLADPAKSVFAARNQRDLQAILDELRARGASAA